MTKLEFIQLDFYTDIWPFIQNKIEADIQRQQFINNAIIFGIVIAIATTVGLLLWYFLSPRSPRQKKARKQEDEEEKKKRKEEEIQRKIAIKLKELDYTCQHCRAPGLKGPKCEYCQNINFSIDAL